MTKSKKKIILLSTSFILTICLMGFMGVYALTILKNSTFNVGVKYKPEYLVKVEMWIDGANGGTVNQNIEDNEYVEIFNSLNPVSNGMYIHSMSNDTIQINSQTLTPIGANGDVYFRITSLENETSGNKDLKCVIDCGSSTVDSGTMASGEISNLTIATGINAISGTPTSSSLGMIKISLKFSEFLLDLKYLDGNDENGLKFGETVTIKHSDITGKTFYVSDINGLLKLSALVGKVDTTTTGYGSNYGYKNSAGSAITFKGATIQMLNLIDCENGKDKNNFSKTFIPIGNSSNNFQGTFDGNDNTITGLYINQTTDSAAGLFGYVFDAEIKNLTMQNCKVVSTGKYVGNFVGYADGVTISNCSAKETEVIGDSDVGGIVGCVFATTVTTITNCYNTGSVRGTGDWVGGIVGECHYATITNCYNTGSVSGSNYAGGIVGYSYSATITNCYNTGSVSGYIAVGGIEGGSQGPTATITNCYNTVSVNGSSNVGGIVGSVFRIVTITNCYNTESVNGSSNVGGIVGYSEYGTVTITNCYNTGSVSGDKNYVGGIVGNVFSGTVTITNCYYLEPISSEAIGSGTATGGYYGKFGEDQKVEIEDIEYGSLPTELSSYSNLKDLLNAWVNINKETNPNLKNWKEDEENINDGYPVFA